MKNIFLILFVLLLCACEKVINLDLPERGSRIVVNGLITDQKTVYSVTLTKTTKYNFTYSTTNLVYEKKAIVIVSDDAGNKDTLPEISPGNYRTHLNKLQGVIGRSYKVDIFTIDGNHFQSDMEKMLPVAKIDSIYFTRDYNDKYNGDPNSYRCDIYIDWHDPANEINYYLRSMSYYWNGQWHDNVQWNWVFNDKYFNGEYLKKDNVNESYSGKNWTFKLNQYSLTKNAYDFWNLVHEQTQSGGDNTNSMTVPLIGNVYNVNNPNDYTLGYFQVSALTTAQIYINR
jgi:hypothetical protein